MDLLETESGWIVIADCPGVSEDSLRVELLQDSLRLSGSRPSGAETLIDSQQNLREVTSERKSGGFCRVIRIPEAVLDSAIRAELRHGVLTVILPKPQDPGPARHRIAVRSQ